MGMLIALLLMGAAVLWVMSVYNTLVTRKNRTKNAFSQIDVQLQRRYDLIPNLVETAKAYMTHERETLGRVTEARNQAMGAVRALNADVTDGDAMQRLISAESALSGGLGRLLAVSESYPDLKADQNMRQLSEELASTENRVSFARQAFNDAVMEYNVAREAFPGVLIAGPCGFHEAHQLELQSPEAKAPVRVSFQ